MMAIIDAIERTAGMMLPGIVWLRPSDIYIRAPAMTSTAMADIERFLFILKTIIAQKLL